MHLARTCINIFNSEDTMSKKKEGGVMDYTDKVYNYMKSFMEENGFNQTVKGIAKELGILEKEVETAINKLKEAGKVIISDIPRKTTIELRR